MTPEAALGNSAGRKPFGRSPCYLLRLPSINPSTRLGSASVEVSPRLPNSFSAILRRIRRMILPLRVFGRPGVKWMMSGLAMGPISLRTWLRSYFSSASFSASPSIKVT